MEAPFEGPPCKVPGCTKPTVLPGIPWCSVRCKYIDLGRPVPTTAQERRRERERQRG